VNFPNTPTGCTADLVTTILTDPILSDGIPLQMTQLETAITEESDSTITIDTKRADGVEFLYIVDKNRWLFVQATKLQNSTLIAKQVYHYRDTLDVYALDTVLFLRDTSEGDGIYFSNIRLNEPIEDSLVRPPAAVRNDMFALRSFSGSPPGGSDGVFSANGRWMSVMFAELVNMVPQGRVLRGPYFTKQNTNGRWIFGKTTMLH
jgi:hypothetical protein